MKLGAEVADLSEPMRAALQRGTTGITDRLARALDAGVSDGSVTIQDPPDAVARRLYQLWLGTSIMVKIARTARPFQDAVAWTRRLLHTAP